MYNNFAVALEASNKLATRRSFVTTTSSGTLFGAVLFLTPEPALVIRFLKVLDAFGLFGRGFAGDGGMAGVYNGFIEPLVAAVGVVGLLAAVVGLDDDGVR